MRPSRSTFAPPSSHRRPRPRAWARAAASSRSAATWPSACRDAGPQHLRASKAALIGLTKGLARDLGPRGITVNVVHPGSTDTDMNPAAGPHAEAQRGLMAIQRFAEPGDVAGLVAWLASPSARSVTGAGLTIDGGANI